ncbi:MAG: hypothetical protein HY053_00585 [Proteobacteria bacterium]|nr:hypothetical protein [Pseudomonadota bacterium]
MTKPRQAGSYAEVRKEYALLMAALLTVKSDFDAPILAAAAKSRDTGVRAEVSEAEAAAWIERDSKGRNILLPAEAEGEWRLNPEARDKGMKDATEIWAQLYHLGDKTQPPVNLDDPEYLAEVLDRLKSCFETAVTTADDPLQNRDIGSWRRSARSAMAAAAGLFRHWSDLGERPSQKTLAHLQCLYTTIHDDRTFALRVSFERLMKKHEGHWFPIEVVAKWIAEAARDEAKDSAGRKKDWVEAAATRVRYALYPSLQGREPDDRRAQETCVAVICALLNVYEDNSGRSDLTVQRLIKDLGEERMASAVLAVFDETRSFFRSAETAELKRECVAQAIRACSHLSGNNVILGALKPYEQAKRAAVAAQHEHR